MNRFKILILIVVAGVVGLSSCKKSGDLPPVNITTVLDVINADTNSLNVYQNGTRLNNISSLSPGSQSGYLSVAFGIQQYEFKLAGNPNYVISNYQLNLDTAMFYSLFAAGETADKLFLTTDVAPVVSSTQAVIRFVNASPGSTGLTVSLGSLSYSNTSFKYASAFTYIASGITTINIYPAGSATPVLTGTITLAAGSIYTLFTKGTLTGTGNNQLSAALIINE